MVFRCAGYPSAVKTVSPGFTRYSELSCLNQTGQAERCQEKSAGSGVFLAFPPSTRYNNRYVTKKEDGRGQDGETDAARGDTTVENFLTVGQQVIVLFLLILVGFLCGRFGVFGEKTAKGMAEIALLFATPCAIIQSFQREKEPALLKNLGLALLISLLIHAVTIALVTLVFREKDGARRRVLRFGTVFSNAGYMALPLQQAVLGSEGVFYGAAYIAVFNVFLWSWGLCEMSGDRKSLSAKKLLLNPGLIGVLIGVGLFLGSVRLPEVLLGPVKHLAALNTPLPMLIVGYHLSHTRLGQALCDRQALFAVALRLVAIPAMVLALLYVCGVRGTLLVSCTIAASAPIAAATSMFATKYNRDIGLSVNLVSVSTLLSAVTMPLIVGVAKLLQ